jgi:hypothetical protein
MCPFTVNIDMDMATLNVRIEETIDFRTKVAFNVRTIDNEGLMANLVSVG